MVKTDMKKALVLTQVIVILRNQIILEKKLIKIDEKMLMSANFLVF